MECFYNDKVYDFAGVARSYGGICYFFAGMARSYGGICYFFAGMARSYGGEMNTRNLNPGHSALRKGRVSMPGQIYLVTTATLDRQPFFANFTAAQAAAQTFEDKAVLADAKLLAWVLMPDYFHGLVQLGEITDLCNIMNRLKSASARRVNRVLRRKGALWANAFHDHALRQEEDVLGTARYIVANPIRAGMVRRVGDYPFWDAVWLPR